MVVMSNQVAREVQLIREGQRMCLLKIDWNKLLIKIATQIRICLSWKIYRMTLKVFQCRLAKRLTQMIQ